MSKHSTFPPHIEQVADATAGLVLTKLRGDVSTRQFFRLEFADTEKAQRFLQSCSEAAELGQDFGGLDRPQECSLIAMLLPGNGSARASRIIVDVGRYIENCGVPVPKMYLAIHHLGFLVIEDLGDTRLFDLIGQAGTENVKDIYRTAIEYLVYMQFPPPEVPRDCTAYSYSFSADRFLWELNSFLDSFSHIVLRRKLSRSERSIIERDFQAICREMMSQELVFTHRDYHSRNLMIRNARPHVIDFQDARLGPILYDIASLIFDPYVPLERDDQQELFDHYFSLLPARPRNTLRRLGLSRALCVCAVQRCLKAAGTYVSLVGQRGESELVRYVPRALANALKAARRCAGFVDLCNMLAHWLDAANEFINRRMRDAGSDRDISVDSETPFDKIDNES
ncbi:MAG TPA: phosphotransferase [bacterium]|nr:phosphotransferase [bacterium]